MIAVSTVGDHKPHQMVIQSSLFTSAAIADWATVALAAEIEAVSDGLPTFRALRAEVASHLAIVTGSG